MDIDLIVEEILAEIRPPMEVSNILYEDLIKALIIGGSIKEASNLLDLSDNKLEHILERKVTGVFNKPAKVKWDNFLLSIIFLKKCSKCKGILSVDLFGIAPTQTSSGIASVCLNCDTRRCISYNTEHRKECRDRSSTHYEYNKADYLARNTYRRALKLKATAKWADLDKIRNIYRECPAGFHVDHIVPLQGVQVCGLHVEGNLQYLSAEENLKKSNIFYT